MLHKSDYKTPHRHNYLQSQHNEAEKIILQNLFETVDYEGVGDYDYDILATVYASFLDITYCNIQDIVLEVEAFGHQKVNQLLP